jgi:hypothetical protein
MDINEKRFYILNVIGKGVLGLVEDLDFINQNFLNQKDFIENHIQYGNTIYFVSKEDISFVSEKLNKARGEDDSVAYVLLDITDNLNPFDFVGNITKNHENSKEFVDMIKSFTDRKEESEVVKEKTDEELLAEAIEMEDYEEAVKIRDRMSRKESVE